ncbi:hypothetical protein BSL78_03381 [Apostichopus japonicus]|uniref:Fibrinogen C-terminal domain-containing protein n=1 Tax=Stichopus japonicus TaxID=307972 RepID=A0A2G8LHI3_STIJA|nr:hypothetical protein BSL78_03381 [Apostichopus japonicus]
MHLILSFCIFGAFVSSLQVSGNTMNLQQNDGFSRNKRSTDSDASYFFYQQPDYPRDCKEVFERCDGESSDGVYLIQPDGYLEPFPVYCNNTVDVATGWSSSVDWIAVSISTVTGRIIKTVLAFHIANFGWVTRN